jgi:hypothetical protein
MWRGIVSHRWLGGEKAATVPLHVSGRAIAGFVSPALPRMAPSVGQLVNDVPRAKLLVATRPNLEAHLALVARFAALCRDNGVKLMVATNPMRGDAASLYEPADLRDVVERVSRIVPVWDFSAPAWLAFDPTYWEDSSHFKPTVAAMMLERMSGAATPADFGVLRGEATARMARNPM